MDALLKKALNIRYVKLRFELEILEDTILPKNKAPALRGGMGEMLLRANCIRDRQCKKCDFEEECIVNRIKYSKIENKPSFMNEGDSVGYVFECEDYKEMFREGDILKFNLILFGSTIVYLNQILQAFFMFGEVGIGKNASKFLVKRIRNTRKEVLLEDGQIYKPMYEIATVNDYVDSRIKHVKNCSRIIWHTPAAIKQKGCLIEEFSSEAIFAAICRRILMLDCYEKIETEKINISDKLPYIMRQEVYKKSIRRYSSTHDEGIYLKGITGIVDFDYIDYYMYKLLLAGELIHIGKNTSFGFGKYILTERKSEDESYNKD